MKDRIKPVFVLLTKEINLNFTKHDWNLTCGKFLEVGKIFVEVPKLNLIWMVRIILSKSLKVTIGQDKIIA